MNTLIKEGCIFYLPDDEAVDVLLSLLGTDKTRLIGPDAEQPSLLIRDDRYSVVVEDVIVGTSGEMGPALLLWAVAHSVFAQHVRRGERRALYIFIQNFILGVSDCTVVPKLCWSVARKLHM